MNKVLDMTCITKKFFPKQIDDPMIINRGNCFNWAMAAYIFFKEKGYTVELYTNYNNDHTFVKIDNLYYDSESPRGVSDLRKLNCYKTVEISNSAYLARKYSERTFIKRWKDEWPERIHGKNRVWGKMFVKRIIKNKAEPRVVLPCWYVKC